MFVLRHNIDSGANVYDCRKGSISQEKSIFDQESDLSNLADASSNKFQYSEIFNVH